MRKIIDNIFGKSPLTKGKVPNDLKKVLAKNHACYILITCAKPTADGNMQVEMSYEGDACLAAYLIETAQGALDDDIEI